MRSIRVGGRTHSWVVEAFLREKEGEEVELYKGGYLQSSERTSKATR
jgi:hypothetical protein